MIAMRVKDRIGEVVWNRTSLLVRAGLVDSIFARPAGCLKGRLALHLSNSSPFYGTLMALPSWSVARSGPLWYYIAQSLRRLRTKLVE